MVFCNTIVTQILLKCLTIKDKRRDMILKKEIKIIDFCLSCLILQKEHCTDTSPFFQGFIFLCINKNKVRYLLRTYFLPYLKKKTL